MVAGVRQVRVGAGWARPSVRATSIPPTVCPNSLATEIMPLAPPVRVIGAVISIALLLGGGNRPTPAPATKMRQAMEKSSGLAGMVRNSKNPVAQMHRPMLDSTAAG